MFTSAVCGQVRAYASDSRTRMYLTVLVLLLSVGASGAHAQRLDLGRMLGDSIKNAFSGCGKYRDWLATAPVAAASRDQTALMPLIEDAVFVPVFGKPYRDFTPAELAEEQKKIAGCRQSNALASMDQLRANQLLNPSQHRLIVRQWQAIQAQRDEFAAVQRELATLPATPEGLAGIDRLSMRGEAALRDGRIQGDLQTFRQNISLTRQRIGEPVLIQRVADAVTQARGMQGVQALAELHEQLGQAALSAAVTQQLREQINVQLTALATVAVAEERVLLTPPSGGNLASLAAHTQSVREFDGRTRTVMKLVPGFGEMRRSLLNERASALPEALAQVSSIVASTRDASQPTVLLRQYFLEEELVAGAGANLRSVAAERSTLLQRISADVAVFGPQPEHDLLLGGERAKASTVASRTEPTRCDLMAAHPDDPARVAPGVPDERFDAKAAVPPCIEAVRREPQTGRLIFQLARAQLYSGRPAEAVITLKRAVELQHGGAHYYLSEAYIDGAPGLPRNERLANELAARASALGFGPGATIAGATPSEPVFAESTYEDASMMKAVYYGKSTTLDDSPNYRFNYLLAQAYLLAGDDCKIFRLSEVEDFRSRFQFAQLPSTQSELFQKGFKAFIEGYTTLLNFSKDPRSIAQGAAASRRVDMAGAYGARDLSSLAAASGYCKGAAVKRYAKNLRVYMGSR